MSSIYREKFNTYVLATEEFENSLMCVPTDSSEHFVLNNQFSKFSKAYEYLFELMQKHLSLFYSLQCSTPEVVIKKFCKNKSIQDIYAKSILEMNNLYEALKDESVQSFSTLGIAQKLNDFYDNMLLFIAYFDFDENKSALKEREATFFTYSIS